MKKLAKLLNHDLTREQQADLNKNYDIQTIIPLPADLQSIWSQVDPRDELNYETLDAFTAWIVENLNVGDYLIIQGEYGLTFCLVDFALNKGFVPIYATTERIYAETRKQDGSIENKHIFKHVTFKEYRRYIGELDSIGH